MASESEIEEHLLRCDMSFSPPLNSRVKIKDYAYKIHNHAMRFEAWVDGVLVGLVAVYCNDKKGSAAFITSVSVLPERTGTGIAACLMKECIEYVSALGMKQINLEVASDNEPAIRLYKKFDFITEKTSESLINMNLHIKNGEDYER
jgi:ribosomal protein S18 acetylase RimI-like enzyme